MATLRPATLSEIILAIRDRVTSACRMPRDAVFVTATESTEHLKVNAERLVGLRPTGETPAEGIDGGGRYVNRRRRTMDVVLYSRMWLDETNVSTEMLTKASLGHFTFEDLVVNVLEDWFPLDREGNAISEPVACLDWLTPARDRKDAGWVSSRLEVAFVYSRLLTLPEVA